MKKTIEKFYRTRSKMGFLVFLVSILLLILMVIPELLSYSNYLQMVNKVPTLEWTNDILPIAIKASINSSVFMIIVVSLLAYISLYNIVGYIYNKAEFMFIGTGLYIMMFFIGFYVLNIGGLIFVGLLTILNLLGYLDQVSVKKR